MRLEEKGMIKNMEYDVFISHASEDKLSFVEPLAKALQKHGLKVWYDRFELKLGDSLREKIDQGLSNSRYGVVILSRSFFAKEWPKSELDALVSRQNSEGKKVILPIWHNVGVEEVNNFSPILASKLAAKSTDALGSIANQIKKVLNDNPAYKKHAEDKSESAETGQEKTDLTTPVYSDKNTNNEREGYLEPKPPEILQELLWIKIHGTKHWKLILVAVGFVLIGGIFVLPQINIFNKSESNVNNILKPNIDSNRHIESQIALDKTKQELETKEKEKQSQENNINEIKQKTAEPNLQQGKELIDQLTKETLLNKISNKAKIGDIGNDDAEKLFGMVENAYLVDLKEFFKNKNGTHVDIKQSLVNSGIYRIVNNGNPTPLGGGTQYILTSHGEMLYNIVNDIYPVKK